MKSLIVLLLFVLIITTTQSVDSKTINNNYNGWSFQDVGIDRLRESSRKVFAHYFALFPISIDNVISTNDYYTNGYLNPNGEGGVHASYGGFIRERPLPRPVRPESNWEELDMQLEVERASRLGLDGFSYDMLGLTNTSIYWTRLLQLMEASQTVDPSFKILLMPDMTSGWANNNPYQLVSAIKVLLESPYADALYRDSDGSLVVSPYKADELTPAIWADILGQIRNLGTKVKFFPVFPSIQQSYIDDYGNISIGFSQWDGNCASYAPSFAKNSKNLHQQGFKYMAPVMPQDHRPKDFIYWEASNSGLIRATWEAAINGSADWVQVITWNDYSEGTELSPSSQTQFSFYDLSAYYLRWYKLGSAPLIVRDSIYYFHRISLTTQLPKKDPQLQNFTVPNGDKPVDKLEVVLFLTSPATLEVHQLSTVQKVNVTKSGLSTVLVDLIAGATPSFKVTRGVDVILELTSSTSVWSQIGDYQDLLYRGGGLVSNITITQDPSSSFSLSPLYSCTLLLIFISILLTFIY